MSKSLQFFPEAIRIWAYRDKLTINEVTSDYEILVASNKEDLEMAYKLVHDMYVKKGLMDSDPSGMRCNVYSILPYTTVIIGKFKGEVVATVSLIKDSQIGFPSDKDYLEENNQLRQKGYRLVEVSSLAVSEHCRKKSTGSVVSLLLMRYLFEYTKTYMNCDMMLATVHPNVVDFYSAFFNFQKNKRIVKYNFVKQALAQHIYTDIHNLEQWMHQEFMGKPHQKNMANFFQTHFSQYKYPERSDEFSHDVVMTPELIKYFFVDKTNLLPSLSTQEVNLIISAYKNYFSLDFFTDQVLQGTDPLKKQEFSFVDKERPYRFSSNIDAVLVSDSILRMGTIFDISTHGAFIKNLSKKQDLEVGTPVKINFSLQSQIYTIHGVIQRKSKNQTLKYPSGYGILFNSPCYEILQPIINAHKLKKLELKPQHSLSSSSSSSSSPASSSTNFKRTS